MAACEKTMLASFLKTDQGVFKRDVTSRYLLGALLGRMQYGPCILQSKPRLAQATGNKRMAAAPTTNIEQIKQASAASATAATASRIPSQHKVFKDDERISEPVSIKSTMNKEGISMDESLDQNLGKLELMEAKCRQEEKFNQILQKLEEIEACRSKATEVTIADIRTTTAILKASSSPTPMAPPPPTPTKCLTKCPNNNFTWVMANSSHIGEVLAPTAAWELGDNKDKGHTPCIVTNDSPKVTPAKCSNCSSPDIVLDLTVAVGVSCATTMASMELLVGEDATSVIYIDNPHCSIATHAKCSTLGLNVNGSANQPVVVFPTITAMNGHSIIPTLPLTIMNTSVILVVKSSCASDNSIRLMTLC
ncbi:hypothetical protein OsI_38649 [Oryza sativa Indica Group]|uniref:Uncharacterized protein n=1 Tax=Oryza sativa subsp. indica TaxID=39946 RepID=B8BMD7_ORYSI|nr:hypothetical protein OsI_38649 [Oryza sativa Indica Group]